MNVTINNLVSPALPQFKTLQIGQAFAIPPVMRQIVYVKTSSQGALAFADLQVTYPYFVPFNGNDRVIPLQIDALLASPSN